MGCGQVAEAEIVEERHTSSVLLCEGKGRSSEGSED